jgi:DNA-binding CsgD family transcriptional regulator
MDDALQTLSEREKDALRLLASGHDAKSLANHLGLSVHTVNERLREARRKLGVSSSRAAARRLAEAEAPQFLADKKLGEARASDKAAGSEATLTRQRPWPAWLFAGSLIMISIVAAAVFSLSGLSGQPAPAPMPSSGATSSAVVQTAATPESTDAATAWIALLDQGQWAESWASAGAMFTPLVSAADWAAHARSVREGVGAVVSRVQKSATRTASLPGAPAGDYTVIQYQTTFANRPAATETAVFVHEAGGWKAVGYFVR